MYRRRRTTEITRNLTVIIIACEHLRPFECHRRVLVCGLWAHRWSRRLVAAVRLHVFKYWHEWITRRRRHGIVIDDKKTNSEFIRVCACKKRIGGACLTSTLQCREKPSVGEGDHNEFVYWCQIPQAPSWMAPLLLPVPRHCQIGSIDRL